jgi:hypothetical protein
MEFNSKDELVAHIRGRVRQIMGKTTESAYQGDPNSPMNVMLARFPELRQTLEKLLTMQFRIFVNDIQWVAPKPTTFKIILANGQFFNLIWNTEDFLAKILGKKYDMLTLKERENAVKAVANLLQYSTINTNMSPEDLAQQNLIPAKGEPVGEPSNSPTEEPTA